MPIVAMTREMGSKGKDIALGLAERMKMPIVHHNLVEHDISERMHVIESDVHRHLEGGTSMLERWRFPGKILANMTASEVYELAEKDNVIIRGWGSTHLLQSVDHVLRVRVCAPMDERVNTLMDRLEIKDESYARREIITNDTAHGQLMKRMMHGDWRNSEHYDLVINTGRVPIDEGVDLIEHTLQLPSFQKTSASQTRLSQLRIESQLRTLMLTDAKLKSHAASINFQVDPNTLDIILSGGVRKQSTREKMVDTARTVQGIGKVENNIALVKD